MHLFHRTSFKALRPALLLALLAAFSISAPARAAESRVALQFHAAQTPNLRHARLVGRLAAGAPLHLALTLPLRNQAVLDNLLRRMYTPGDPLYGHYLTSDEFVARFGPTEDDYKSVGDWARSQGLVVTGTHPSRTVLDVAGPSAHVESAFGIQLNRYQVADGRVVFANSAAPTVPRSISARLAGVAGLSSLSRMRPLSHLFKPRVGALRPAATAGVGTGPAGGLSPNDIKFAYNLATVTPLYGSIFGTGTTTASGGMVGVSTGTLSGTGTGTTGTNTGTATGTNTGTTTTTGTNTGTTTTTGTNTGTTTTTGTNTGTTSGTGNSTGVAGGAIFDHLKANASGTGTAGTGTTTAPLLDGTGQTLGVFALDTYLPSDIALFVNQYSLPTILPKVATATTPAVPGTVQPVSVDQFNVNGKPSSAGEVTLDIEMMLALAPNATAIYSYEGSQGTVAAPNLIVSVDIFQQMADAKAIDGSGKPLLQVISTSYGIAEEDEDPAIRNALNSIFQKMAAQGQSVFCATGDTGAFDRYPETLSLEPSVDSPASQPFVTGVGGTTLSYNKPTLSTTTGQTIPGSYGGEIVWKTGTVNNPPTTFFPGGPEGGGGGSSVIWPKPDYQAGLGSSPLRRDVPDVALNADLATGYDIYFNGVVNTAGGTSAAAPLWAAFAALVNQQRGLNGLTTTLGFANPPLYALGRGTDYNTVFHDITVGDNLLYQAQPGYDDASGFGSFIGDQMIAALSSNADQGTGTATLTGTVTDSATGLGVGGVTVTATSISTGTVKATATTDGSGAYTLTVPAGLALTITVDTSTIVSGTTNYAAPAPVTLTLTSATSTTQNFALTAAHTFAAGLQMISAPYDFSGIGDFATEFGLATPLASPNPRLIQWEPLLNSYVFYPNAPADMLRPGQGYWIKFPAANYLHRLGAAIPTTQSFQITLQAGWNQIGDPFLSSVPVSSLTADTVPSSGAVAVTAANSPIQSNIYRYDQGSNTYVALDTTAGTLDPFVGYWIFAKQTAVLTIPPPGGGVPPPPTGGVPPPP